MKQLAQIGALGIVIMLGFIVLLHPTQAAPAPKAPPVDAATLFGKKCASCHGKDGQAKTFKAKFNHARNLTDAKWQADVTDERIFNSISNGRGKMPSFGKKLAKAEIESLVAYVRGLKK